MTFAHSRNSCDIRDYQSSGIRDNRDSARPQIREYGGMSDPQIRVKVWLGEELKKRGHGVKSQLAEAMGISKDMVTKILELEDPSPKKRRQIKPHEFEPMARFLNALPPGYEGMTHWLSEGHSKSEDQFSVEAKLVQLRELFSDLPEEARPAALADLAAILARRDSV